MTITTKTFGECGCCGKKIDLATAKAAEMTIHGKWYTEGKIPAGEESQGVFDLGAGCFKSKVKKP